MDLSQLNQKAWEIIKALAVNDPAWNDFNQKLNHVHLAILDHKYIDRILVGLKTIESRFTKNRIAPYQKVNENDVIFLKRSGGDVKAIMLAGIPRYFEVTDTIFGMIRESFGVAINADDDFWNVKKEARYASLIDVKRVAKIETFSIEKKDRRTWIVLI